MFCCSQSGVRTLMPKKAPKATLKVMTLAVKPRWRKTRRSTIGLASVSSQIRNATKPIAATMARPAIIGEANQSCSLPRSSMTCRAPTQTINKPRPTRSTRDLASGVSCLRSNRQANQLQIAATGTLIQKMEAQPTLSQRVPPRIGPRMGATKVVMAHNPVAAAAYFLGKTRSSRVWDSGISGPPQAPCSTRNSTSRVSEGARPQRNEKSPKPIMPATKTFTAPKRADSQPVKGTTTASATA
jgi:hypothetical protein